MNEHQCTVRIESGGNMTVWKWAGKEMAYEKQRPTVGGIYIHTCAYCSECGKETVMKKILEITKETK